MNRDREKRKGMSAMPKKTARMLCALLALALLPLQQLALAGEDAAGELRSVQISNIALGAGEDLTSFQPALTLVLGEDGPGGRGLFQLLLAVRDMTAINVVAAYEEGLVKARIENMASSLSMPAGQAATVLMRALSEALIAYGDEMLDDYVQDIDPYLGLPLEPQAARAGELALKLCGPAYRAALAAALLEAIEEQYPDWYRGEREIEQDGLTATARQYEFALASGPELGVVLDLLCQALGAEIEAMVRDFLAIRGVASFAEFLAMFEEDLKAQLVTDGTLYVDGAGRVARLDLRFGIHLREEDISFELAVSLRATAPDEENGHLAFSAVVSDPDHPKLSMTLLALELGQTKDGEKRSGEVSAEGLLFGIRPRPRRLSFAGSFEGDDSKCAFDCALGVDGVEALRLEGGLEGEWRGTKEAAAYGGALWLALTQGPEGEARRLTADVDASVGPMPAGRLLDLGDEAVNPLVMDRKELRPLEEEIRQALLDARDVLARDPATAAISAGDAADGPRR